MRKVSVFLPAFAALFAAAGPVNAATLTMPDDAPGRYAAYSSPQIAQPWVNRQADAQLSERPMGEIIATRLGLVEGSAELFRYRLENAPSNKTVLDGVVGGGGIKLKLTW